MLPTIILKPLHHLGSENIALYFTDNELSKTVKLLQGIRWFQTKKCWYLPLSKENYLLIKRNVEAIATLHTEELRGYLEQRSVVVGGLVEKAKICRKRTALLIAHPLCAENLHAYSQFQTIIQLRGYSPNTLRTYCDAFYQLLRLLGSVSVNSLSKEKHSGLSSMVD